MPRIYSGGSYSHRLPVSLSLCPLIPICIQLACRSLDFFSLCFVEILYRNFCFKIYWLKFYESREATVYSIESAFVYLILSGRREHKSSHPALYSKNMESTHSIRPDMIYYKEEYLAELVVFHLLAFAHTHTHETAILHRAAAVARLVCQSSPIILTFARQLFRSRFRRRRRHRIARFKAALFSSLIYS